MNELAIKLAELLEISVEAAIKLYPEIRSQYIVYKSLDGIDVFATAIFVTTLAAFVLTATGYVVERPHRRSEDDEIKKLLKLLLLTLIVSMIIKVGINALTAIFATDLRMLLEFM